MTWEELNYIFGNGEGYADGVRRPMPESWEEFSSHISHKDGLYTTVMSTQEAIVKLEAGEAVVLAGVRLQWENGVLVSVDQTTQERWVYIWERARRALEHGCLPGTERWFDSVSRR